MKKIAFTIIIIPLLFFGTMLHGQDDPIAPQVDCLEEAVVQVFNNEITLYAIDFNKGSKDNLSAAEDLRFTFTSVAPEEDPDFDPNQLSSALLFENVDENKEIELEIYVWDEAGNHDFCSLNLFLLAEDFDNEEVSGEIVFAETGEVVDYSISMTLDNIFDPNSGLGELFVTGHFGFTQVESGTYKLSGFSDNASHNGVTTLDLVLMLKHILQLDLFSNPTSIIAADVYQDDVLNALDIIQLRRSILGMFAGLPNNTSWRFGNSEQVFPAPELVLEQGLEDEVYFAIDGEIKEVNFQAIKVGDVNHSYARNIADELNDEQQLFLNNSMLKTSLSNQRLEHMNYQARANSDTVAFFIEDVLAIPGDLLCIPIRVQNFNEVAGFQFPLSWDRDILEFHEIGEVFSQGFYFNENLTEEEGELFVLWTDPSGNLRSLEENSSVIEICFNVIAQNEQTTNLGFTTEYGFETGVFNQEEEIPSLFFGGQIGATAGCVEHMTVSLSFNGQAEIFAEDLYIDEEPDDVILVNGANSIIFDCDDIGINTVDLEIIDNTGQSDSCSVYVEVRDLLPPIAIAEPEVDVMLDENLMIELSPEMIDDGSYDACGPVHFMVDPPILDCNSPNPSQVVLTVVDESGNLSSVVTFVNITYPPHPNNAISCRSQIEVEIAPENEVQIWASDLLLGDMTCSAYYEVELFDGPNGEDPQPDNILDFSDVGNTYFASVSDPQTESECWTEIIILEGQNDAVLVSIGEENVGQNESFCIGVEVYNFNEIGGFQFPLTWDPNVIQLDNIEIPTNSPLNLTSNINVFDNGLLAVWIDNNLSGYSLADGSSLFDLCFTAIGPFGASSPIDFFSAESFFNTEFIGTNGEYLPYELDPGLVNIQGIGCVSDYFVDLNHVGAASVQAEDLYFGESPNDILLINNQAQIDFTCEDIGTQVVTLTLDDGNGNTESCQINLHIRDHVAPVAIVNVDIDITLNENLHFVLEPEMIDEGSYDNCGSVSLEVFPPILDCESENPAIVELHVTDEWGNTNYALTYVNIIYPPEAAGELSCRSEMEITLSPNSIIEITAADVLEGPVVCPRYYEVLLFANGEVDPEEDNFIDYSDAGSIFTVQVTDPQSGDSCWTTLIVEAEDCDQPFTLNDIEWPCDISLETCDLFLVNFDPNTLLDLGVDLSCTKPLLNTTDCQIVGMAYDDQVFEYEDSTRILRSWTVIDWLHYEPGTTTGIFEYPQVIIIYYSDAQDPFWICDILPWTAPEGDCNSGHSLEDAVEWPADIIVNSMDIQPISLKNNPNVHPNDVEPRIFVDCHLVSMTYEDVVFTIENNITKVSRTWTVLDWATENQYNYVQEITIPGNIDGAGFCAYTEHGRPLGDVFMTNAYSTSNSGCVNIPDLLEGTIISPVKESELTEGLDVMDLITLYKAVLGIEELTPYQLIAADINENGVVTSLDAVLLEKIIEGTYDAEGLQVWKFVDAAYVFDEDINNVPMNYPSWISYDPDKFSNAFIGVKMGDLNGSFAGPNYMDGLSTSFLRVKDEALFNGEQYNIPFLGLENAVFEAIQLQVEFNSDALDIIEVSSNILEGFSMDEHVVVGENRIYINYSISNLDIVQGAGIQIAPGMALFNIEVKALDNAILNQEMNLDESALNLLKVKEQNTPYVLSLEWKDIILNNDETVAVKNQLELYPQPADEFVQIKSNDLDLSELKVDIYNSVGQKISSVLPEKNRIDVSGLNEGIYLFHFNVDNQTPIVKKVLIQ